MIKIICNSINKISDYFGWLGAALIFLLALLLGYDVIMRYVFNKPTSWVLDISQLLQAALAFTTASYVLKSGRHVNMNMVTQYVSPKWQRRLFLISNTMTMIGCGWMSILSWSLFTKSYKIKEAAYGIDIPLYPWKILVAFCFLMISLQCLSLIVRTVTSLTNQFIDQKGEL
jgi:C4-dicarboxylate transporter DctQ subunit